MGNKATNLAIWVSKQLWSHGKQINRAVTVEWEKWMVLRFKNIRVPQKQMIQQEST